MNDDIGPLTDRLDSLARLIALVATADMKVGDKIVLLGRAGFDRKWIADICDTTPDTVSVRLSEAKRRAKKVAPPMTEAKAT